MTVNRILYVYLLLFAFILFVLFDVYLFHLLLIFLVALPALSFLLVLPVRSRLMSRLHIEDEIVPGGQCKFGLVVENRQFLPCAYVRIQLTHRNALGHVGQRYLEADEETIQFALGARRGVTLHPALPNTRCGRTDIAIRRVSVCDMLGLVSLPVPAKNIGVKEGSVYVLPQHRTGSIQIDETADMGLESAVYSTEKPGGDPSEIFQLRDYREGDSRRSVHWKLSSRMNRLIVREFGLPLNPLLHFLLELQEGAGPEETEEMLSAALAFSEYLMAKEIVHGISFIDGDGALRTVSVTGADALASAIHELLAMPGQKPWEPLMRFATQETLQQDMHLIYLIAGAGGGFDPHGAEEAERAMGELLDSGVCRKLTLMPANCKKDAIRRFRSLGCEVQLLNGEILELDAEEAL